MKKRCIAALLVGAMLLGSVAGGCGTTKQGAKETKEAVTSEQENGSTETTTNVNATGEAGALSLMNETNQLQENVVDDNYRTFYEAFVYSFYDSDGDGIGDLNGLTSQLDYLNDGDSSTDTDLGVNGIWLMPIMPSTTYHKYDVTDYCDIDPEYGTMDDFDAFVSAAHERGINVIIDFVMNHTSSEHPWFTQAVSYLQSLSDGEEPNAADCPYVDYYNFSKEKQTNYYEVPGTDWYYEAQFWSEMPDLNLGSDAVRAEFDKIVDFWLAHDVDGFRMDAVKEYYSGSVDKNVEVLSWFNQMVKEKKEDAYIVGEAWLDLPTYAQYYASGMDSCFDFDFADSTGLIANTIKRSSGKNASSYGKELETLQDTISKYNENYIDAPFYTNHDMARGAGYYSGDDSESQTKIAQAMNLLMSGSAFLYYGEELGMKGSGKDENKRTPMYWSKDENAQGMCDGPKDMDTVKMKYDSLEEQKDDENSIYNYVKQVIKIRNAYPEIVHGNVTFESDYSDENVCTITKTYDDKQVVLVYNISGETQTVDLAGLSVNGEEAKNLSIGGSLLAGTEPVAYEGTTLTMPAYSVVVLK